MRGEQGDTIPRALNDCGSPKSPNNVTTIFLRTNICFQKISSTIVGAPNLLLTPAPSNLVALLPVYSFLFNINLDLKSNSRNYKKHSEFSGWAKKGNAPLCPRSPASNVCMFSTAWNQCVWNENYAKKKQLLCLSRNPSQCALQVNWIHYAASGQFQVSWSGIYEWGKKKQGLWYMGWWSIRSTAGCLSLCGDKTGAFKHRKANTF